MSATGATAPHTAASRREYLEFFLGNPKSGSSGPPTTVEGPPHP
jgi:hypothetical protein